ncbi:hypothetical protein JQ585_12075 [Bradyrhizobium sp. U87765 SZCCT0109]|nr:MULTISPECIES: hypothetical protein [unclassified Bradyrhizobium]MBR1304013.1 hypothetical protein [Bradyrhizobium sp. U87765 SZCCT0110]MBR1319619.1 hypothetical protein [Bradyrhizobium sp. U87765 SZCCT0109]
MRERRIVVLLHRVIETSQRKSSLLLVAMVVHGILSSVISKFFFQTIYWQVVTMQDENHDGENHHNGAAHSSGEGASGNAPSSDNQAAGAEVAVPEIAPDRIADILNRLTTLEISVQQLRVSVDVLTGNTAALPGSLITILNAIGSLANTMSHLTTVSNLHGSAVSTVAASTNNLLNHATMIYADTQALRLTQPLASCADPSRFAGAAPAGFTTMAFATLSDAPGEVGRI